MNNLIKTFLYIDIIIFIFIALFIFINRYFTTSDVKLLDVSPTPLFHINTDTKLNMSDIYGNLCGERAEIDEQFYLSNNYISIIDPISEDYIFYSGANVPMKAPGAKDIELPKDINISNPDRYYILPQFNDDDGTSCRRCYGVNPNLYEDISSSYEDAVKESYIDMNECRFRAEDSCRLSCIGLGSECMGYLMLEKRITLPPPAEITDDIPGSKLTRNYINHHQKCLDKNSPNLLQPMHDIYCGLITPDSLERQNKRCVTYTREDPNILGPCKDTADCQGIGICEAKPQSSFDNYKTIAYTCGHGSGVGGIMTPQDPVSGVANPENSRLNYIVQQNNNINPSATSETLSRNPPVLQTFQHTTFSARGLLKNFSRDDIGWQLPALPIPIQDQWYVPCQVSTHLESGSSLDSIDIGTANYKILNPSDSFISNSPIQIPIVPAPGQADLRPYLPQVIAQKICEEKCTQQDFERDPVPIQKTPSADNQNYNCGGYTVTQLNSSVIAPSTRAPLVNFDCKIYNTNVKAEIPYQYHPLTGPSRTQACPPAPPPGALPSPAQNCPIADSPDIVVNLCGMKVDLPVSDNVSSSSPFEIYFPTDTYDPEGYTGNRYYNTNISYLIRAGNPLDNNYFNSYIYNQFNPPGSYETCIQSKQRAAGEPVSICDENVPFGKIRTNTHPPQFMKSPINDKLVSSPNCSGPSCVKTNMWFPWKVP